LQPASERRDVVRDERPIYLPEANGLIPCKVLDRYAMPAGQQFDGPVLIEEPECTTLVLPRDTVRVSEAGNLVITIRGAA
jgi:N-methylhydantoinase A